jgi:voltage-gated potassium channel
MPRRNAEKDRDAEQERAAPLRRLLVGALSLVAATAAYAFVPLEKFAPGRTAVVVATFVGALVIGCALVVWQVRSFRQAAANGSARLVGLLMAVYAAMLLFSTAYYLLAFAQPDQIEGLHTRTDALYFTMSTLSTVGFGDVHAAGQAARAMVTLQLAFDLLVIGIAVSTVKNTGVPSQVVRGGRQPE